jgi:hypothetical protein
MGDGQLAGNGVEIAGSPSRNLCRKTAFQTAIARTPRFVRGRPTCHFRSQFPATVRAQASSQVQSQRVLTKPRTLSPSQIRCRETKLWPRVGATAAKVANRSKWLFAFMSTSRIWLAHGPRASKPAYPCSPSSYTMETDGRGAASTADRRSIPALAPPAVRGRMEAVRDEIERERGIPPALIESMGEAGLSRAGCKGLDACRRAAQ